MALVIPEGAAQVSWRFLCDGDAEEMLVTCGLGGVGSAADTCAAAVAAFEAAFAGNEISQSYTFVGTRATVGTGDVFPEVASLDVVYGGTANPARFAPNTCILVRKNTVLGGRANRGRFYLPPLWHDMDDTSAAGILSTDAVSGLQAAIDTWFDSLAPVLLHDEESPAAGLVTAITSLSVQARMATQRRRLRP